MLSDDIHKLAFINAVYSKKETGKGPAATAAGYNEEGKAGAAGKAASDTQTGIFGKQEQQYSSSSKYSNSRKCSSSSSKCSSSSSSKYKAAMQQQQR